MKRIAVCEDCKEDLRTNPMYRELGMVLICNHKKSQSLTENKCDTLRGKK